MKFLRGSQTRKGIQFQEEVTVESAESSESRIRLGNLYGGPRRHLHQELLKDEDGHYKPLPAWARFYAGVSYIVYGTIAMYSIFYLIYLGIHQENPRMGIPYYPIITYLEYNSYSVFSPLICPVLMVLLSYHVYHRVQLDEGDFFGLLGVFLLFALINIHDAAGIFKLMEANKYWDMSREHMEPPVEDNRSTDAYHWQYAWSTFPSCAKQYVLGLRYAEEYQKKKSEHGNHQHAGHRHHINEPVLEVVLRSLNNDYHCNTYHHRRDHATVKDSHWMTIVQNDYQCCGPYGNKHWMKYFSDPDEAGCKDEWKDANGEIPNCYHPLMEWLEPILVGTFWIMIVQALLYIFCMIFAVIHRRAMTLQGNEVGKTHSLLNLSSTIKESGGRFWRQSRPSDKPLASEGFSLPEYNELHEKGRISLMSITTTDGDDDNMSNSSMTKKDTVKRMLRITKRIVGKKKHKEYKEKKPVMQPPTLDIVQEERKLSAEIAKSKETTRIPPSNFKATATQNPKSKKQNHPFTGHKEVKIVDAHKV